MEYRRFGRTGHMSSVAIFGAAGIGKVTQPEADAAIELALSHGVNHIDIAPSYGQAELRMGPWMGRIRERVFLGCKTTQRTREGAAQEMRESLGRLRAERFDLFQLHAVTTFEDLDRCTMKGGALEAVIEARDLGLTQYIGITGHGVNAPAIYLEALRRFDFDTVLFPINFVQYANPEYRRNSEALLQECARKDVGTMIIKSVTMRPWGDRPRTATTWYEPFTDPAMIQRAVNFVLSQPVTGLCTAGDVRVLTEVLRACENFTRLNQAEQEALIAEAGQFEPLFA